MLTEEIKYAVRDLDCNKSCGIDAEQLKYFSKCILPLLSMCFIGTLVHGIISSTTIYVILVPIIKYKTGKINSKDNYRIITLTSVISNVFNTILLGRMDNICQPMTISLKESWQLHVIRCIANTVFLNKFMKQKS